MAEKYKTWMADLPDRLTHVPISCLAIPGSHDSATSNLETSLGVGVDQTGVAKTMGSTCCGVSIIHRWSKTQNLSIKQQLHEGIRYFDFRISSHPTNNEIRFIHGLYADLVIPTLAEIKAFSDKFPKELLILDFNHFYNMRTNDHVFLLKAIRDIFKEKLVPQPDYNNWLPKWGMTLSVLWATTYRVIVIYHDQGTAGRYRDIWPKYRIETKWANTAKPEEMIAYVEDIYVNGRRFSNDELFIWPGVLTPSTSTVALHLGSSLDKFLASEATEKFVQWLQHQCPGPKEINICTADFVERCNFIQTVVDLNKKVHNYPQPLIWH